MLDTRSLIGRSLYYKFDKVLKLTQIMRQDENQTELRELLQAIRTGTLKKATHWPLLEKRDYNNLSEEEKKLFNKEALKICATNKACKAYNVLKLKEKKVPVAVVEAVNEPKGSKDVESSKAGGLPKDTLLAEGGKVMLHSNLWTEAGLTNGSRGTIWRTIYRPGRAPPAIPDVVLCRFPQFKGKSFIETEDDEGGPIVPICPKTVEFFHYGKKASRTIVPLSPCDALTCHKCQGFTCTSHTLMDLGSREFCVGLFYVALSRVKELNMMAFSPMPNWQRMTSFMQKVEFKERLAEEQRLENLYKETLAEFKKSQSKENE